MAQRRVWWRVPLTLSGPGLALFMSLALRWADPPPIAQARLRIFDVFQTLAPRAYQPAPVRIIDLDDETLRRYGQWPWPRTLVARLLEELTRRGAEAVAFDIIFAEPDRTSPAHVLPLWPSTPALDALRAQAASLPDHDQQLAQRMRNGHVVSAFSLTAQTHPDEAMPLTKASFAFAGDDPRAFVPAFVGAVPTLRLLEDAAAGNGHVTLLPELDGVTRRTPLLLRLGEQLYPSLAAEALRVASGASVYVVKSSGASGERSAGAHTGIVSIKIGPHAIPTDQHGRVWIYYTRPQPSRTVPAWRVLDGTMDEAAIRGSLVFVGTSAAGLQDIRLTPYGDTIPGVEIHAQLAEQMLTGVFLRRPDWADGAELLYLAILGLTLMLLLPRVGAAACAVIGLGSIGLACGWSWLAFANWRWLVDPVMPSVAIVIIYLVSSFTHTRQVEEERRWVREAFRRYLSPSVVDELARSRERLRLGGETKPLTVLFADIRGFTSIAERLDAEPLTHLLNTLLTPMTDVILRHGGTIDKYIGDCLMAFWNAPLDDPAHAQHAATAALALQAALAQWNRGPAADARDRQGHPIGPLRLGIGINTGPCCVGNLGSEQRFDYSALGDAVNLSARLESQTKHYGVDIIVGESTAEQLSNAALLELDYVRVAGKRQPVKIFGLLGDAAMNSSGEFQTLRRAHQALLEAFRAREWALAERCTARCRAARLDAASFDRLYDLYAERVARFRLQPPTDGWDGAFDAEFK